MSFFYSKVSRLFFLVLMVWPIDNVWGQLKVGALTCEHVFNPRVVDVHHPRLAWINQVSSAKVRGEHQTAYRICVASSKDLLLKGKPDVWDTGKVSSSNSYLISYDGSALKSGKDYWWRVMVWNNRGIASNWSEVAYWGMGLLSSSDWKAQWIGASSEGIAPLLRKSFEVDNNVASAKVFVSGLGYFELYMNGRKVANDYFVPNLTNYTSREGLKHAGIAIDDNFRDYRVLYMSYDITNLLQKKQNVIGAILGNGFYDCKSGCVCTFGTPCLLCQIEITYKDGRKQLVCSDDTWKVNSSPILMNGVYNGEQYDANREISDWSTTRCEDVSWQKALLCKSPIGKLTAQTSPADKITEVLHPISLAKQSDGTYLVDFGKEIAGWIHFKNIEGHKGDTVKVKYICESPLGIQQYIMKGAKRESYAPRFTWYVFRKAVISGISCLTSQMLAAEAVNTDVKLSAVFKTSNKLFNQINAIWQRSQLDNMHGCIASDCPHRERSPYTGDGQVSCVTVMHNFDAAAFYQKWIRDIRDVQNIQTGYVPNSAPWQPGCGGGVPWGAAMNIMPWEYYVHYGDKTMLSDNYFAMKEQVRYMLTWLTADSTMVSNRANINAKEPNYWLNLGDWAPAFGLPTNELVHTFYLWRCADFTARAAKALNNQVDFIYYSKLADNVKAAFHRKFYQSSAQTYGDFGSNIFALVMGVPYERYRAVVNTLRHEIVDKYKGHLNTGIFGTQFFFETLANNGLNDVAYEAMNKTDFPSYGNWIRQGATTTWEQWNGADSHNHPMFGGGLTWFYRILAGVNADENSPGYKHFIVKPILVDSLQSVYYSNLTPYGKVVSEVIHTSQSLILKVTVPVGSTATVYIPAQNERMVSESGCRLGCAQGVKVSGQREGCVVCDLLQGCYQFVVNAKVR